MDRRVSFSLAELSCRTDGYLYLEISLILEGFTKAGQRNVRNRYLVTVTWSIKYLYHEIRVILVIQGRSSTSNTIRG
jgi:hypothetical protein